jgi:hypothetical protein
MVAMCISFVKTDKIEKRSDINEENWTTWWNELGIFFRVL